MVRWPAALNGTTDVPDSPSGLWSIADSPVGSRVGRMRARTSPAGAEECDGCRLIAVGVAGFEPATSSSRTKRAAGLRHTPMSRTETMRPLGAPVSYHRHARSVERGARTSRPCRPPSANCPLRFPRSTDHGGRRSSSLRRSLPLLHLSSDAAVFPGHASAWTVFRWENLSEESVPVCVPSAIVTIDERTVSASFIE